MEASTPSSMHGMMPPMVRPLVTGRLLGLALAALVAVLVVQPAVVAARPRAATVAKPKRYLFQLTDVTAQPAVGDHAAELTAAVRAQTDKVLSAHPQLVPLPADAPPVDADAAVWKKFLATQKLDGAYRVNIEIMSYEEAVEDLDPGDKVDLRLTIRLTLRMFGETVPARKMGFNGDGSATIKAEVGRKLRPRDRDFNVAAAIELAVNDALASSLHTIETAPPAKKK